MCPLPLFFVVAVKVFGVVTSRAETKSVCNDLNFTIVSVSMDICARAHKSHFAAFLQWIQMRSLLERHDT